MARALICRTATRVDGALLDRMPELRIVASASAGRDHVDEQACAERQISCAFASGCNASAVADYTLGCVIDAVCRMRNARIRVSDVPVTVGLVGLGEVGRRVKARCEALGIEVLCCDPPLAERAAAAGSPPPTRPLGLHAPLTPTPDPPDGPLLELPALLERCDVLSLHVPLTSRGPHATRGLVSGARLGNVGAVIQSCRGGVLVDVGSAPPDVHLYLDVWEGEPCPPAPALEHPGVRLATPHIAGYGAHAKWSATTMLLGPVAAALGVTPPSVSFPTSAASGPAVEIVEVSAETFAPLELAASVLRRLLAFDDLDAETRALAKVPEDARAAAFRALRGRYIYRTEWALLAVELRCEPGTPGAALAEDVAGCLRAAGVGRVLVCPS